MSVPSDRLVTDLSERLTHGLCRRTVHTFGIDQLRPPPNVLRAPSGRLITRKFSCSGLGSPTHSCSSFLKEHERVDSRFSSKQPEPREIGFQVLIRDLSRRVPGIDRQEAERNAGDPGVVLARRLSNAEYDYTIRDLTGVDIRPTREFPVDPANQAGFDNSGESLAMSAPLLKKYLGAARLVAEHVVLKPEGFTFAPHPVATDTDRDKYCVKRIIDFYERHKVDYADYFLAAHTFRHRARLGRPEMDLGRLATEAGLSPKYLGIVWSALTEAEAELGPLAAMRNMWNELPLAPPQAARLGCVSQ